MDYLKNIADKHMARYRLLTKPAQVTQTLENKRESAMQSPFSAFLNAGENSFPVQSNPQQAVTFQGEVQNNNEKSISFSESFNEHASITKDFAQEVIDKINVYERRFHHHIADV